MLPVKSLVLAAGLACAPLAALAQTPPANVPDKITAEVQNQAVFCNGEYALCIKAPCVPIVTLDRLGNYTVDHAACSCVVEKGWSMGPGQCADRQPVKQGGRTFMISTYSNHFDFQDGTLKHTLTCPSADTAWAWCYGAPCVVDERDPTKTTCNCPIEKGPMQTLGGNCTPGNCNYIYSAATPAGDVYASNHFYNYMKANQPGVPVEPPPQLCTAR